MISASKNTKQPQAIRHEEAMEKCKIYQRSLSSKQRSQSQFQNIQIPLPGQFALQNTDLGLTKIPRMIMKEPHVQTPTHFLSRSISKKEITHSSSNLRRYTQEKRTASQIEKQSKRKIDLPQLKESQSKHVKEEEKKTSYLIKPKVQTAKFASGYRGIKLEEPKLKLIKENIQKLQQTQTEGFKDVEQANFLPIQYYLIDEYKPQELMKIYKFENSEYVLGFSRWYDLQGKSSWKKCRVLGFDNNTGYWSIEWLHNSKTKKVSRANLYFEGQSKTDFENRLKSAQSLRKNSQIYLKYNIEIDQNSTDTFQIPQKMLENIVRRVNKKNCGRYSQQLIQLYNHANKQAQFNSRLPFDQQRKRIYQDYFPPFLFKPNQQYLMRYKNVNTPIMSKRSKKYFQTAITIFKQKTSLSQHFRLLILSYINELQNQQSQHCIFYENSQKIISLSTFLRHNQLNMAEFTRKIQRGCCEIEHFIGKQLDQLYTDKKNKSQEFQREINQYNKFISMVIIRLQNLIRQVMVNSYESIVHILSPKEEILKIEVQLLIKESKIDCSPSPQEINKSILNQVLQITHSFSNLTCPSKSYLCSNRTNNLMSIQHQPYNFDGLRDKIKNYLNSCTNKLDEFINHCSNILEEMVNLPNEVRNKMQKKITYAEIENIVLKVKDIENKLKTMYTFNYIQKDSCFKIACFYVKCEETINKVKKKFVQGNKQLYKLIFDKIIKENEKIEKSISFIQEKLEMHPQNINQMLYLEKVIKEMSNDQFQKVQNRIKELPQKIKLLETIDIIQYPDYQLLHRIYVAPFRLRQKLKDVKKDIENTYRKKFWDEINREAGRILQVTRECSQQLLNYVKIQSLEQMCDHFSHYRILNQKIEFNLKQASIINEREQAMSWTLTDFGKLNTIRNSFKPYFSLVTLAKNHQVHLQLLANSSFSAIDPTILAKQLDQAINELKNIKEFFKSNTRMLRISMQVYQLYSSFIQHLPLIQALRNPDLRQRHWISIKQIIAINPLRPEVSLKKLLNQGGEIKLAQLQEISAIATRQLVYERRLIRLKREWKEIKFQFEQRQGPKIVVNLKELCSRVQIDIFQIQEMLGVSFIKFLQAQVISWRNQILYKAFQFLQKWEKQQNQVILLVTIFNKPRAYSQMPREHFQTQLLEKTWRNLCNQLESQPSLNDILQSKALQILSNLEVSTERIRKQLYMIFEQKKREYARLACISDDLFVNLLSYDESDPNQNPVFEQTVRKCFQNIKALIRNDQKQIVKICISSGQEIKLKQKKNTEKSPQFVLPNQVIIQLEKEIQNQLKDSLITIKETPDRQITQILLLYQRLNFVLRIEEEIRSYQMITPSLIRELQLYRDELLTALPENPQPKNYTELLQALYHLQLATSLSQSDYLQVFSFSWISQPRTYLKNDQYEVRIGLFAEAYAFQITDLDGLVVEEWSTRVFCNMAGALRDRGFCLLNGQANSGKSSIICKLAAIFGRKEQTLDCGNLVSSRNLLQLMRIAASGIWVILKNFQNLASPQLSMLSRNIQSIWTNFLLNPNQNFQIEGSKTKFKTKSLKIFGTINLSNVPSSNKTKIECLSSAFRNIFLSRINLEFIIGSRLLILRMQEINPSKIQKIVQYVHNKLQMKHLLLSSQSKLSLVMNFLQIAHQISKDGNKMKVDQIESRCFFLFLKSIVREYSVLKQIINDVNQTFESNIEYQQCHSEIYKEDFIAQKYFYNQSLLNSYADLQEAIKRKKIIILTGPTDSGKTALLKLIKISQKIKFYQICPNAYSLTQLYGNMEFSGIICRLIEKIQRNIKKQPTQAPYGILFDGRFDEWAEPLAKINIVGHISQPNGNILLVQEEIKLIFECKNLEKAAPSLLIYAGIVPLNQPLKWQNIFSWYMNTQLSETFRSPLFLKFIQPFVPYIVDPLIQFYQNIEKEYKQFTQNTFVEPKTLILSLLKIFEALLHFHFLDQPLKQLSQKICSDSFNLFILSLIWTFGVSLPLEGKKSFQRHFKYLIKRAVQLQITGVSKQSLPGDEQDLFINFYYQGRWQEWNKCHPYVRAPYGIIQRPIDIGLTFFIQRNFQRGEGFLLFGPNNGHKTLFMQSVQKSVNKQAYNFIKILLLPTSNSKEIGEEIVKQINKYKYSFNFQGFPHGKKTVILIRDLNLPLTDPKQSKSMSHYQFIRHYFITKGWYLNDNQQHYNFKNIIFCGTLNHQKYYPRQLGKYFLTINRTLYRQDLHSIIKQKISNMLQTVPNMVEMILDLHFTVVKEFQSLSLIPFTVSQINTIVNALSKFKKSKKTEILRFWIFLTQKIYQQRLKQVQLLKLFYLINNVLIQKEKIRYKEIKPKPESFGVYMSTQTYNYYNIKSLKKEVQTEIKSFIFKQTQKSIRSGFQISKQENSEVQNLMKFRSQQPIHQSELKILASICSTLDLDVPYILAFSHSQDSESSQRILLHLKNSINLVSIVRKSKLIDVKLKSNNIQVWRKLLIDVIQLILSNIERNRENKQIILYFADFQTSENFIVDDLVAMKRKKEVEFQDEIKMMIENFVENRDRNKLQMKLNQNHDQSQFFGNQNIGKSRERKFEFIRREKQRRVKQLNNLITNKIKIVFNYNINKNNKTKFESFLKNYNNVLREFSLINLDALCSQRKKVKEVKFETQDQIDSSENLMITQFQNIQNNFLQLQQDSISNKSQEIQMMISPSQEAFINRFIEKISSKFTTFDEKQWQRGKGNDFKLFYMKIRQKMQSLAQQKLQDIRNSFEKIGELGQIIKIVSQNISTYQTHLSQLITESQIIQKQKVKRQFQYEKCVSQNQNIEKNLVDLQKQKTQLQIIFERAIQKCFKEFYQQREKTIEMLKTGKDRKIIAVSNEIKILLQFLGLLYDKKIKKQEEMYRQVIKDINDQITNNKIIKKVTNMLINSNFNVSEKLILKIKDSFSSFRDIFLQKIEKKTVNEENYIEKLNKRLKMFFFKLIECYDRLQQKEVKEITKRLSDNQKIAEKMRENLSKSLKSFQYKTILESYQDVRQRIQKIENTRTFIENLKMQNQEIWSIVGKIDKLQYPKEESKCGYCNRASCKFICLVLKNLVQKQQMLKELIKEINSLSFSVSIFFHFNFQRHKKIIEEIILEISQSYGIGLKQKSIFYNYQGLSKLSLINQLFKLKPNSLKIKSKELKKLQESTSKLNDVMKQFQTISPLALMQFISGLIVVGVEAEGSNLNVMLGQKDNESLLRRLFQLYGEFKTTASELISLIKKRNQTRSKISEAMISKMSRSNLDSEFRQEDRETEIFLIVLPNKQQVINCINLLFSLDIPHTFTIIVVTSKHNLSATEKCYLYEETTDQSAWVYQKINDLLTNSIDKNEKEQTYVQQNEKNMIAKKQNIFYTTDSLLMLAENLNLSIIKTSISDATINSVQKEVQYETFSLRKILQTNTIGMLKKWTNKFTLQLQKGYQLQKQSNFLRTSNQKMKQFNQYHNLNKKICRLYQILIHLQTKGWLPLSQTDIKFWLIVKTIFQREDENNKKVRQLSQIKFMLWNTLASHYPKYQLLLFLTFHIVFQMDTDMFESQTIPQLLDFCLSELMKNLIYQRNLKKNSSSFELISLYFQASQRIASSTDIICIQEEAIALNSILIKIFARFESFFKEKNLVVALKNNKRKWYEFLKSINSSTMNVPLNFFQNNRMIIFFFLCVFNPTQIPQWLSKFDDFQFYIHCVSPYLQSSSKVPSAAINELSFVPEWTNIADRLNFHFHNLHKKQVYLLNYNVEQIVEICQLQKVNFKVLDFSTLLWKIDKSRDSNIQKVNANYQTMNEALQSNRIQDDIIEELKNYIRNQAWIIINLDHNQLNGSNLAKFYNRINELFEAITNPEKFTLKQQSSQIQNEVTVLSLISALTTKIAKNVDIAQYRYLLIFTTNQQLLINENHNSQQEEEQQKQNQIYKDWIRMIGRTEGSFVQEKNITNRKQGQIQNIKHFRLNYYKNIVRSKNYRKDYKKLEYLQKRAIFSFITIADYLFKDLLNASQKQTIKVNHNFIRETVSKVYSCLALLKKDLLTTLALYESELTINKFRGITNITDWQIENDPKKQALIFRLHQYITLLVQHSFQLYYKTNIYFKRVRSTHEYVVQLRSLSAQLNNYEIQTVCNYLKLNEFRVDLNELQIVSIRSTQNLDAIPTRIYSLEKDSDLEDKKKIKEQNVIDFYLNQCKNSSFSKIADQIDALFQTEITQRKQTIQVLKKLNIKLTTQKYQSLLQKLQELLMVKNGNKVKKQLFELKGKLGQGNNLNTIQGQKYEINRMGDIMTSALQLLYQKGSNYIGYLSFLRSIVREFTELDYKSLDTMFVTEKKQDLISDQEQNKKRRDEEMLKKMIAEKYALKNLIQKHNKILLEVQKKINYGNKGHIVQNVSFSENLILQMIQMVSKIQERQDLFVMQTNESIQNYKNFQKQNKNETLRIQKTIYIEFQPEVYIYRFTIYDMFQVIQLNKLIHSKRYHKEVSQLSVIFKLTPHQRRTQFHERTVVYFKGFKMINSIIQKLQDQIIVLPSVGEVSFCEDYFIQAQIDDEIELQLQEQQTKELNYLWYACPFYCSNPNKPLEWREEERERVRIRIKESDQNQIAKSNIYMIN